MAVEGLTAGAVARRLGVAVTTLRTWHQRYGLGPTRHEPGQHRRYSPEDVARLELMQRLTADGVPPGEAARWVRRMNAEPSLPAMGGTAAAPPGTPAVPTRPGQTAGGPTAPGNGRRTGHVSGVGTVAGARVAGTTVARSPGSSSTQASGTCWSRKA